MNFKCKECRFWVSSVDQPRNGQSLNEGEGECRRRAPVGGGVTAYFAASKKPERMIAVMYPWPVAHAEDWCGEFIALNEDPSPF